MPHCAAFGCTFQSKGNKETDVSLHSFTKDKKRRKLWEIACGRKQLPMDPRLCSRHFSPEAFDAFSRPMLMKELTGVGHYKRRLKPNAVPTVFQHKPTKLPRETTEVRSRKRQRQEMLDYLLGECKQTATADVAVGGDQSGTITEDESCIQSTQQSVSVQYSPKTNDVATQTEKYTSDAAVQRPADAHHVYAAANCENTLKKQFVLIHFEVRFVVCFQYYHFHLRLSRVQTEMVEWTT